MLTRRGALAGIIVGITGNRFATFSLVVPSTAVCGLMAQS
jgi:hypothetical protein